MNKCILHCKMDMTLGPQAACYNFGMSPKGSCVNTVIHIWWHYWEAVNILECGA